MKRCKVNIYNFLTYALIFAMIKPYFLPEIVRQFLKIIIIIGVFLFIVLKSGHKRIYNISLIFCLSVFLSAIVACFRGDYEIKDFLDSLLYMLTFYDVYTFISLCYYKGRFVEMLKCMYRLNCLYCYLTVISVLQIGIVNNSNQAAYVFGNKFTSSYLFILFLALYGATHDMEEKRNIMAYYSLFGFSILFTLYLGCATATVTLVILLFINFLPRKGRESLLNPKAVVIALVLSASIITCMELILKNGFVDQIVSGYFNKTYTVAGRLEIYNVYLKKVILERFWFGHGYSNSFIKSLTGLYSNAQNGLLEIFVNLGFVGVLSIIVTVFYCYKKSQHNLKTFYLSLVVYGMIIAAVFEISLNWFFILGICLIRWNEVDEFYIDNIFQKRKRIKVN